MSAVLLRASLRALPARVVGLHLLAATVLVAATWPALEHDSTAVLALRGVAVLLATALALAVDEPAAPLLDATPTPMAERLAARLAVCAVAVLPVWAVALALASLRGADVPVGAMTLELATLIAVGLAAPMALRRWWRVPEPAIVAGPVLLGALLGAAHLPPGLALLSGTPLDPTWDPAHLRWSLLLLAGTGLLLWALADPSTARAGSRGRAATPVSGRR